MLGGWDFGNSTSLRLGLLYLLELLIGVGLAVVDDFLDTVSIFKFVSKYSRQTHPISLAVHDELLEFEFDCTAVYSSCIVAKSSCCRVGVKRV